MQNALLIGLSRQVALGRQLDVIANNIANLNTSAFKADGALFEAYVSPNARANDLSAQDSALNFVRDRATWVDWAQGAVQRTGNPLDVAIEGKGFLTVQTQNGDERYTRNGSLKINAQGQLVTSAGDPVLGDNGPIVFQKTDRGITISKDGTISARVAGTNDEATRGRLRVVSFENTAQLQKDGNSYYAAPEGVTPDPDKQSVVLQGAIEKSNISAVLEMTHMIEVTRSYAQTASLLSQQSELQNGAIDKLAEVPR